MPLLTPEQRSLMRRELSRMEDRYASAPTLSQMPRRNLSDKGIDGPTAAHVVEEIHVPHNYAYVTFTTGTSAFQTPVGVVPEELAARKAAGSEALRRSGIQPGEQLLITYAPLVNVFSAACLSEYGVEHHFLKRSCKESLLSSWAAGDMTVTVGESSFLRSALEDAIKMGLKELLPERMVLLAAGTPLDPALPELLEQLPGWSLHDLYGCQEFGWLALDGVPLRPDITFLFDETDPEAVYPVVGGIIVGDCFRKGHHLLNRSGTLVTHARQPARLEWETLVKSSAVQEETLRRAAKSILRMKSRIVRVASDVVCGSDHTEVLLVPNGEKQKGIRLVGPKATRLLDDLVEAQKNYQKNQKRDGAWKKDARME